VALDRKQKRTAGVGAAARLILRKILKLGGFIVIFGGFWVEIWSRERKIDRKWSENGWKWTGNGRENEHWSQLSQLFVKKKTISANLLLSSEPYRIPQVSLARNVAITG
jgi:hypothetical protein